MKTMNNSTYNLDEVSDENSSHVWNDNDKSSLSSLMYKIPNIEALTNFSSKLTTLPENSSEYLAKFIGGRGIQILLQTINNRFADACSQSQKPKYQFRHLDIAIFYECLQCLKAIMNTAIGMEHLVSISDALSTIARCLNFQCKIISLLILDMLTYCSCCSIHSAIAVYHGMQVAASANGEAPFAVLSTALVEKDVEQKTAVMKFINSLLVALKNDDDLSSQLNCDLSLQFFDERYEEAMNLVDSAIDDFQSSNCIGQPQNAGIRNIPQSAESTTCVHFEDVYRNIDTPCNLHKVDLVDESLGYGVYQSEDTGSNKFMGDNPSFISPLRALGGAKSNINTVNRIGHESILNHHSDNITERGTTLKPTGNAHNWQFSPIYPPSKFAGDVGVLSNCSALEDGDISISFSRSEFETFEVKSKFKTLTVCPQDGTMAGPLITTKSSKFMTLFTKKTKIRWFEIDNTTFRSMENSVPEIGNDNSTISISNITDIKVTSTNTSIANETAYSFEIETASHSMSLGCNDMSTRDKWLTALYASLEKYVLAASSYKVKQKEVTDRSIRNVIKFADMFKKQGAVYSSITMEAQRFTIDEHGINVNDIHEVSLYLQNEMLAAGLSSKLLQIFHEFLLIPAKTESAWDAIHDGIKIVRRHCNSKKMADGSTDGNNKLVKDAFLRSENSRSFVQMLKTKMNDAGSLYPEVSRLAMITIAHEKEKNELLDRIRKLEEEYLTSNGDKKKLMSIAEANEQMRVMRMAQKIKDLEEFFASDQIRIQKLDNRIRELEGELDMTKAAADEAQSLKAKLAELESKASSSKLFPPLRNNRDKPPLSSSSSESCKSLKSEVSAAVETPITTTTAAVEEDEEYNKKYFKYKMLKKMLPEGAVRHKMSLDGFSEEEIDSFLSGKGPSVASSAPVQAEILPPPPPPSLPTLPDKFEKYRTMKKILPLAIVKHKMTADGLTADEIEEFIAIVEGTATTSSSVLSAPVSSSSDSSLISLSSISGGATTNSSNSVVSGSNSSSFFVPNAKAKQNAQRYEALRACMSADKARQKMISEGVPEVEIDRLISKSSSDASPAQFSSLSKFAKSTDSTIATEGELLPEGLSEKNLKIKPSVKLKGLFWSKLKPNDLQNTMFANLADFDIPDTVCKDIDELFAAKVVPSMAIKSSDSSKTAQSSGSVSTAKTANDEESSSKPTRVVSVLDGKRIQNVLIVMGKLRRGPEEIMNMIIDLDPQALTSEVTASIISILPLSDEVNALKCHNSPVNLDQASKLYYYICRIPRLVTRLDCHEIAFSWQNFSKQVSQQIDTILKACTEIESCKAQMQTVLSIVLALGNYLNADTKFGNAHGFKLEAINKLEALKASKSTNGSMIHILANLITDHAVDVFAISQSWTAIPSAANMSLQQTMCDVTKLEQQVNKMNQEFIRIKDAHENIGLDGVLESCKGVVTYPLHRRLNEFLISAKPKIAVIKTDMKTIEKMVASILGAYGEKFSLDGDEDVFKRFFSSIFVFFRSLRTAADDNVKRRKAQEKEASLKQEQKARAAKKEASNLSSINNTSNISNSSGGSNSVENKSILNRDIFASPSPFSKGKLCCAPTRVKPRRLQLDIPKENNNNFTNVSTMSINGSITGDDFDQGQDKTPSETDESIVPLRKKRSGMVNLPGSVGAAGLCSPRSHKGARSDSSGHNAQGKRQSPRVGNTCNSPRRAVLSPRMPRNSFKDF